VAAYPKARLWKRRLPPISTPIRADESKGWIDAIATLLPAVTSIPPLSPRRRRQSAFSQICVSITLAFTSLPAVAEVKATNAWVRATVPTQKSTGAFVTLTSTENAKVVAAESPAAKIVEIHESKHEKGVMRMRALDAIELPAGKPVQLAPGGKHVMLMGLAKPVAAGETLPIVLTIEDASGKRSRIEVRATARPLGSR